MNTTKRIFWLLAMMIFTCGCSTIRTTNLPGSDPWPGEGADTDRICRTGDKVTLELRDGSQVTGTILEITDLCVSLQNDDTHVRNEIESSPVESTLMTTVPRAEIVTITMKVGDTEKSILLMTVIGVALIGVTSMDFSWGKNQWDGIWEGGIMTP